MSRLDDVISFIEYDSKIGNFIEPESRYSQIKDRLFDALNTYNPGVIVKAGLGSGDILLDIVKSFKSYVVVVEPSISLINNFMEKNKACEEANNIKFINGDFHNFPVDYYKADMLICIDYMDIFDSSKCIDEFKIAIQFEGILFFSGVVLEDNDIDGIYDDYKRKLFPLHNDYYLENDLKTFMDLKDFKFIKGTNIKFEKNLNKDMEELKKIYNTLPEGELIEIIKSHESEFKNLYNMKDDYVISEPYFIGMFMRKKPQ